MSAERSEEGRGEEMNEGEEREEVIDLDEDE